MTTKKVFVGLSGGVDSSVSAALLKEAGYDVIGVFIRVWQPDFFECTWKDDRLDAMRVCAKLGISFVELDLEKEYKKEVVDYMIREYKEGKTPNPDVMCNRFIKFGGFYRWAMKQGANFIATGHYARVGTREFPISNSQFSNESQIKGSKLLTTNYQLLAGLDASKDQSYFLWQIRKEQLPHILFPVGGMVKTEVRKLAKEFDLITAGKKDSQGLCFIGKIDMKDFLRHYLKEKQGKILDERGEVLGTHSGALFYTIGERIGLCGGNTEPLYVVRKDNEKNTVTVSSRSVEGELAGTVAGVTLHDCNWLEQPQEGKRYGGRTRYRQPLQSCTLKVESGKERRAKVTFEKPQTVAPGQSFVAYDGDRCLGGGIIY